MRLPFVAQAPFILFYKSGVTKQLENLVFTLINQGLTMQGIESVLLNRYWEEHRTRQLYYVGLYTHLQSEFAKICKGYCVMNGCHLTTLSN